MGPIICRTHVGYGFSTVKSEDEKLEINNIKEGKKNPKTKKKKKKEKPHDKREKREKILYGNNSM